MTLLLTSPLLNSSEKYKYGMKLLFIVKLWMRLLFLKKNLMKVNQFTCILLKKSLRQEQGRPKNNKQTI